MYDGLPIDNHTAHYFAMISWLDSRVGEVMDFLRENDLEDSTCLFYVSDNGHNIRNSKGQFSENGQRSPILVRCPRTVGGIRQELVQTIDFLPTILDYAKVPIPPHLEGRSLRPILEGKPTVWRDLIVGQRAERNRLSG